MSEVVKKYPEVDFTGPLSARLRSWTTPDYRELRKKSDIPVMFMDSFRVGGMYNCMIDKRPYLGEAISVSEWFQQRESSKYDDPMFVKYDKNPGSVPKGCILGDVFVLDPVTLLEVDRFLQNTKMFVRQQTWVWMLDQKSVFKDKTKMNLKVWVYLAHPRFFEGNPYRCPAPNRTTSSQKPCYDFDANTASYLNRQMSMYN